MGQKGARLTEKATEVSSRLESELGNLGEISRRKMFGGYGIFESGVMFSLVSSGGVPYFRATAANLDRFEKAGAEKFGRMPYYSLPADILADPEALSEWAADSIAAAHGAKSGQVDLKTGRRS